MSVKKRFLDMYMKYVLWKSHRHQDEFRQMQVEHHRTAERVMRYDIYSEDVRARAHGKQELFSYVFRIRDGVMEVLGNGEVPDIVIRTDVPTVEAIANGVFTSVHPDGHREVLHDFTVFDAWRIGRLEWDGAGNGLREVNLFHSSVFPKLQRELRLQ